MMQNVNPFDLVFVCWLIAGLIVATVLCVSPFVLMIMKRIKKYQVVFEEKTDRMARSQFATNPKAREIFAHLGKRGSS